MVSINKYFNFFFVICNMVECDGLFDDVKGFINLFGKMGVCFDEWVEWIKCMLFSVV